MYQKTLANPRVFLYDSITIKPRLTRYNKKMEPILYRGEFNQVYYSQIWYKQRGNRPPHELEDYLAIA